MKFKKPLIIFLSILMSVSFISGCTQKTETAEPASDETSSSEKKIRLATMTDEEGRIIGSMMQQLLEHHGYTVESKVGTFDNTTLVRQSIQQGQADLSLDYTGRGMMFISDVDITKYQSSLQDAFDTTKQADEKNGIIWLTYAPFNNTDGIAVRRAWAEENAVKDLEAFAKYVNDGGEMKLAINGPNSYVATAETCLPGWEKAYGFKLTPEQVIIGVQDAQSMLSNNIDGITAAHVYTSSGSIDALDLLVLEDPKVVSPVYSPAPITSAAYFEQHPDLFDILDPLFSSLSLERMREMNTKVSVDGLSESEVAKEYLESQGLLK